MSFFIKKAMVHALSIINSLALQLNTQGFAFLAHVKNNSKNQDFRVLKWRII